MNLRFLIMLLCLFSTVPAGAQIFHVGVPVYDTIKRDSFITEPTYSSLCPSGTVLFDSSAADKVSGVQYYLKITGSALMKDSLRAMSRMHLDLGPVNVGDSFLLTKNAAIFEGSYYTLRFGSRWTFGKFAYAIIAVGTPATAGQPYVCKADIGKQGSTSVDFCSHNFMNIYTAKKTACVVGGLTTGMVPQGHHRGTRFRLYPTVASDVLILDHDLSGARAAHFLIVDQHGRHIQTLDLSSVPQRLQLSTAHLAAGIYYYRVVEDGEALNAGTFCIQR